MSVCMKYVGAGECGKSTFFKQIGMLYGKPWTDEERTNFRRIIHNNTIQGMKTVIRDGVIGLDLDFDSTVQIQLVRQIRSIEFIIIITIAECGYSCGSATNVGRIL